MSFPKERRRTADEAMAEVSALSDDAETACQGKFKPRMARRMTAPPEYARLEGPIKRRVTFENAQPSLIRYSQRDRVDQLLSPGRTHLQPQIDMSTHAHHSALVSSDLIWEISRASLEAEQDNVREY